MFMIHEVGYFYYGIVPVVIIKEKSNFTTSVSKHSLFVWKHLGLGQKMPFWWRGFIN